jgi:arginase
MMSSIMAEVLVIPQWQGYAAGDGPQRGARAIAAALGAPPDHVVEVAGWRPPASATGESRDASHGHVLWLDEIVGHALAARRWLDEAAPDRLLVIGGDCGSDLAPIAWQAARWGDELGVLYLDAHADSNTPASSPSGRFHGMVLRTVLGEGAPELVALCRRPLATEQVVMAGTRDMDPAEREFLGAAKMQVWSPAAIADGRVLAAMRAHRARRWHVHFDLDVLEPEDFPDVTVPTPGGPTLAAVTRLLVELVERHEVVSITVTEHVGGETSARRVAETLAALARTGWGGEVSPAIG